MWEKGGLGVYLGIVCVASSKPKNPKSSVTRSVNPTARKGKREEWFWRLQWDIAWDGGLNLSIEKAGVTAIHV